MLWCKECSQEIDEKDLIIHKYAQVLVCPECGMADFSEAKRCPICEQWFDGDTEKQICKDCRNDIDADLSMLFHSIMNRSKYDIPYDEVVDFVAEEVEELWHKI